MMSRASAEKLLDLVREVMPENCPKCNEELGSLITGLSFGFRSRKKLFRMWNNN